MLGIEPDIKESYVKAGLVKLVFNPVLNHGNPSIQTHQAAECAAEQGRFWEFRDILFENQNIMWPGDVQATVKRLAAEANLDTASFNRCLDEQRYFNLIHSQDELRLRQGIFGQPVFDINGDLIFGPQPFDVFQTVINTKLAQ